MSDGDHAKDDNESRHEAATEVLLGEQSAADGRSKQITNLPHRSDLADRRDSHCREYEDVRNRIQNRDAEELGPILPPVDCQVCPSVPEQGCQ